MTPEKQRVVLAETLGLKPNYIALPNGEPFGISAGIPDYPNDHNAVASIFAHLPYIIQEEVVGILVASKPSSTPEMAVAYSTAQDWTEAILRTLNRWEESE